MSSNKKVIIAYSIVLTVILVATSLFLLAYSFLSRRLPVEELVSGTNNEYLYSDENLTIKISDYTGDDFLGESITIAVDDVTVDALVLHTAAGTIWGQSGCIAVASDSYEGYLTYPVHFSTLLALKFGGPLYMDCKDMTDLYGCVYYSEGEGSLSISTAIEEGYITENDLNNVFSEKILNLLVNKVFTLHKVKAERSED